MIEGQSQTVQLVMVSTKQVFRMHVRTGGWHYQVPKINKPVPGSLLRQFTFVKFYVKIKINNFV